MHDDDYIIDFDDGFNPYPRELYDPEPEKHIGGIQSPISGGYEESSSGKTLQEKCDDDLSEYRKKLSEWYDRLRKTRRMFGDGRRSEPIIEEINEKIEFYRNLIKRTEEQRNG